MPRYTNENPKPPVDLSEHLLSWADAIARNVSRNLPPSFDIEDLRQVARVETWRRLQVFEAERGVQFEVYAYQAVRGACLMFARRRAYREATHAELPTEDRSAPTSNGIEERIQYKRIQQLLGLVVNELEDERQRYVIRRYFAEGVDTIEIAEELKCSISLVKLIRQQAYVELRKRLEARGITLHEITWQ